LSIAASEELKEEVLKFTQARGISVSNWVRSLMERELLEGKARQ